MIEFKNVSVTYRSSGSRKVDALNNINLKINDGEFAFVVGQSGAGKSTLIKLLLKEIDATEGDVIVNEYNLSRMRRSKIPYLRRTIGVVFQDFRLIPTMNVYDNIAFVMRAVDADPKFIRQRVPYVISLLDLQDKIKSFPHELSGGEQQRVAIARAFVNNQISIEQLSEAMKLGKLGEQIVLKSEKAFDAIKFQKYEIADSAEYYIKRKKRSSEEYLQDATSCVRK